MGRPMTAHDVEENGAKGRFNCGLLCSAQEAVEMIFHLTRVVRLEEKGVDLLLKGLVTGFKADLQKVAHLDNFTIGEVRVGTGVAVLATDSVAPDRTGPPTKDDRSSSVPQSVPANFDNSSRRTGPDRDLHMKDTLSSGDGGGGSLHYLTGLSI